MGSFIIMLNDWYDYNINRPNNAIFRIYFILWLLFIICVRRSKKFYKLKESEEKMKRALITGVTGLDTLANSGTIGGEDYIIIM